MSKTKKIAILAIIAMVLTLMPTALFAAATADDTRLAGADRIGTALEIASAGWSSADTVVLAPADQANLVDSLAAAPLAGQENAPILLTFKGSLDSAVKARIAALGAKKVYVIGAVSDAVVAEVDAIDGVTVEKLAGADRWATADKINAKLTAPAGTFVVGYNAVPDALSVASYAAANKYAIVLANADGTVPASKLVGSTTYLVGGTGVVKDYSGATRLGGADRYATNKAVVEGLSFNFDRVYVANGLSMVDALAASSLAAKYNAPVLLANGNSVPAGDAVKDKLGMVIALGGTGVVSDAAIGSLTGEIGNIVSAAVEVKSYDNDTKSQYVAFTVNGKKVTVEAINALGWDVEFTAGDSKTNIGSNNDIFADQTTGLLVDKFFDAGLGNPEVGDYYVKLSLTKGSDIVVSSAAKITIKNLNLTATGISDYKLTNSHILAGEEMNSTKLYVGEEATFEEITVTAGTAKEDLDSGFSIKTSDAGVISKDGLTIKAETPGTATITITYGSATKAITFTVVDDEREAKKVEFKKESDGAVVTSLKVYAGAANPTKVKVTILDQYGDPIDGLFDATVTNDAVIDDAVEVTGASSGDVLDIEAASASASGSSKVDIKVGTLSAGSLYVTVSSNSAAAKRSLELYKVDTTAKLTTIQTDFAAASSKDQFSTDTTLDMSDDKYVVYAVNKTNEDGVAIGRDTLTLVKVSESKTDVVDVKDPSTVGNRLIIEGTDTGTATIIFKDSANKEYTVKITVVNNGYSIKSISLKTPAAVDYAKTYNYKSVLNYTSTGNNPIITGVTLSKAAAQEIRLVPDTGVLYLDKDSNGSYGGDDVQVGYMKMSSTGTIAGDPATEITNVNDGFVTETDDDGTIIFKIYNKDNKIVASKSVTVEL